MENIIERYRRMTNMRRLKEECRCGYAFVGIGGHSTQNLYPAIDYLHIPLSYICCRDARKIPIIERKYRGVKATTRLDDILDDDSVRGVFVCTGSKTHYEIATRVLTAGKSLFIEKPPCGTLRQLEELASIEQTNSGATALAGMQKRYSPAVRTLRKRLASSRPLNYRYVYATGPYPEGDPLLELFIHPLDLVCHLFGRPQVKGAERIVSKNGGLTLLLLLKHNETAGIMELSTNHSWLNPVEELSVNTPKGSFCLNKCETLEYCPHGMSPFGVPLYKVTGGSVVNKTLCHRDAFTPTMANNQVYTQGFFSEIKTFAALVEGRKTKNLSPLSSLKDTYGIIEYLRGNLI